MKYFQTLQDTATTLRKNFWCYVNHFLGGNHIAANPTFSAGAATTCFKKVNSDRFQIAFESPQWLPNPKPAEHSFVTYPFSMEEIVVCTRKSKASKSFI